MSDAFKTKTMKRKNLKNLALAAPPKSVAPSAGDSQIPGGLGHSEERTDSLEIGVEFRLDLRSEDLIVLKELGAGNGGTVSKVQHSATKVIMARKVRIFPVVAVAGLGSNHPRRSFMSKQRKRSASA
jgi:mitogen-activated protein kinase kinase